MAIVFRKQSQARGSIWLHRCLESPQCNSEVCLWLAVFIFPCSHTCNLQGDMPKLFSSFRTQCGRSSFRPLRFLTFLTLGLVDPWSTFVIIQVWVSTWGYLFHEDSSSKCSPLPQTIRLIDLHGDLTLAETEQKVMSRATRKSSFVFFFKKI